MKNISSATAKKFVYNFTFEMTFHREEEDGDSPNSPLEFKTHFCSLQFFPLCSQRHVFYKIKRFFHKET